MFQRTSDLHAFIRLRRPLLRFVPLVLIHAVEQLQAEIEFGEDAQRAQPGIRTSVPRDLPAGPKTTTEVRTFASGVCCAGASGVGFPPVVS